MKANELMIGDLVYSTFADKPCKIKCIDLYESGYAMVKVTNVIGIKDIVSLTPIPLTVEILEKNGFEKKIHYGIFDDYYDFELWEYSDGIWLATYHNCEVSLPDEQVFISFVHELQHFLTHCGIEKEIEL